MVVPKHTHTLRSARLFMHAHRHQMSPLLYASQNGHLPLVELLLSAEADIHKQDSREWTVSAIIMSMHAWLSLLQKQKFIYI